MQGPLVDYTRHPPNSVSLQTAPRSVTNPWMVQWTTRSSMICMFVQEGNAETLQMERQTEEEMRADFIAKSLG